MAPAPEAGLSGSTAGGHRQRKHHGQHHHGPGQLLPKPIGPRPSLQLANHKMLVLSIVAADPMYAGGPANDNQPGGETQNQHPPFRMPPDHGPLVNLG